MRATGKDIVVVTGGMPFTSVLATTFFAFRKSQSEPRAPERPVVQQADSDDYLNDFKAGYRAGFEAWILGLSYVDRGKMLTLVSRRAKGCRRLRNKGGQWDALQCSGSESGMRGDHLAPSGAWKRHSFGDGVL